MVGPAFQDVFTRLRMRSPLLDYLRRSPMKTKYLVLRESETLDEFAPLILVKSHTELDKACRDAEDRAKDLPGASYVVAEVIGRCATQVTQPRWAGRLDAEPKSRGPRAHHG